MAEHVAPIGQSIADVHVTLHVFAPAPKTELVAFWHESGTCLGICVDVSTIVTKAQSALLLHGSPNP